MTDEQIKEIEEDEEEIADFYKERAEIEPCMSRDDVWHFCQEFLSENHLPFNQDIINSLADTLHGNVINSTWNQTPLSDEEIFWNWVEEIRPLVKDDLSEEEYGGISTF